MKNLLIFFALFVAAECRAENTNNLSFRFPVRVINSQRVDLHYLFTHWHGSSDAVTNSRWVLVTGAIANDTPGGWVVDGKTESASGLSFHQKVLIVNPPRTEKQTLETLLDEKKQLEKRNAGLESEANSLENGTAPPKPRRHHVVVPENVSAAATAQKETNVLNQESSVESDLSQVEKQLAAIPTAGSKGGTAYRVDFFVFYTGQVQNGMPVLDFGIPTR